MLYHRKWPFIHEERKGGVKTVAELRSQTTSWMMAQQIEGGREAERQRAAKNSNAHSLDMQAANLAWDGVHDVIHGGVEVTKSNSPPTVRS